MDEWNTHDCFFFLVGGGGGFRARERWYLLFSLWFCLAGYRCSLGEILFKPVSPYLAEVLKFLEGQNYTFLFFELSLLLMWVFVETNTHTHKKWSMRERDNEVRQRRIGRVCRWTYVCSRGFFQPFFLPVTISDGREPVLRLQSAGCMKLHEHLSSATYGYDTSIHLLRIGFSISSPRRPSSPANYIYIHISFFSPDEGCLDWKTDRNDVGYVLHALHSSGEIHKLHPYLLGHTQKQLPVCTAEPFSWKCSKHMQKKDTFFAVLFSACMSPHLQASPPISRFQLPISSTELTKSKQNEKSSFPPCPPFFFFSSFGRK